MEKKKTPLNANDREQLRFLTGTFRCAHMPPIPSDVQGSYTGTGEHGERPVQDVDDL